MDATTLIWIVVGIAIVLVIVVVALFLISRARGDRRRTAQHQKAERLREEARETDLRAREHEAEVARARAEASAATAAAEAARARAAEASLDADRRAGTIDEHQSNAEKLREEQAEKLRKADDVDPYVQSADGARGDVPAEGTGERAGAGDGADRRTDAAPGPRDADAPQHPRTDDPSDRPPIRRDPA